MQLKKNTEEFTTKAQRHKEEKINSVVGLVFTTPTFSWISFVSLCLCGSNSSSSITQLRESSRGEA